MDGLTGIWNRSYFNQRFAEEVFAAQRYGRTVSLILMDLDHFKNPNDSYGHPFGDLVLENVGGLFQTFLRSTDAACRFGGEEFAIILTETESEGALVMADRLRLQVAELEYHPAGKRVAVTASFGVSSTASFSKEELSVRRMVTAADDALYRAKYEGRNRVCLASTMPFLAA